MADTNLNPKQFLEDATRESLDRLKRLLGIGPPEKFFSVFSDAEKFLIKVWADRLSEVIEGPHWDEYCQEMSPVSHAREGIAAPEDSIPF